MPHDEQYFQSFSAIFKIHLMENSRATVLVIMLRTHINIILKIQKPLFISHSLDVLLTVMKVLFLKKTYKYIICQFMKQKLFKLITCLVCAVLFFKLR